jgi:hypothetical protein
MFKVKFEKMVGGFFPKSFFDELREMLYTEAYGVGCPKW